MMKSINFLKFGFHTLVSKASVTGVLAATLFACNACNGEDNPIVEPEPDVNPVEGLKLITEFSAEGSPYTVELYNESGFLRLGYTKVFFAVKTKDGRFVEADTISAFPEMDMGMHKHSTPRSEIIRTPAQPLLRQADYAFLMYSGQSNGTWYYDIDYTVGGVAYSVVDAVIDVHNAFRADGVTPAKVIQSVAALDGSGTYIVALVKPVAPQQGANKITANIYKRTDANTFPPVSGLTLKLDPRMPGMGNHSSPNNVDLTWNDEEQIYSGVANFSMTGYWRLNLILLNQTGETLYGNEVTAETEASALAFDIEF